MLFLDWFGFGKVEASIDKTISIHGKLTNIDGTNISSAGCNGDGTCNFRFDVYSSESGGSSLLSAPLVYSDIEIIDGIFNVRIDFTGNEEVFKSSQRWVQIEVDMDGDGFDGVGTDDMFGRVRMSSVPYAFSAMYLDGVGSDGFVKIAPGTAQEDISVSAMMFLNKTGASGNLMQLQKSGTDVFVIDNDGKVGIGTGTPLSEFDVNGNIILSGSSRYINFDTTVGEPGYGLRDNAGVMEYKNNLGEWNPISAEFMSVNPSVHKIKTTNETIVNSNVLQNDNDLYFKIGSNESWIIRVTVFGQSAGNAHLKFGLTAPVGSSCSYAGIDANGRITTVQVTTCGADTERMLGTNSSDVYELVAVVKSGDLGGDITFQWAQDIARNSDMIVYSGSYLQAYRQAGDDGIAHAFIQGGNSFGSLAQLGTNDNTGLAFLTNGVERVRFDSSGSVGIGLDNPLYRLDVVDNQDSSFAARIRNSSTNSSASGLMIQLGPNSNPGFSNQFISFVDGDGDLIGRITGNSSGGVSYQTTGSDFAEYFSTKTILQAGYIISLDIYGLTNKAKQLEEPLGVVSESPGFVGGAIEDGDSKQLVGLIGQVDTFMVHVSENSFIEDNVDIVKAGDKITISPVDGLGGKATGRGYIVGTVLRSNSELISSGSCLEFRGLDDLYKFIDSGSFNVKTCGFVDAKFLDKELIERLGGSNVTGFYVTKGLTYINPMWYEDKSVIGDVTDYVEEIEGLDLKYSTSDYFYVENDELVTDMSLRAPKFVGVVGIFDKLFAKNVDVGDGQLTIDEYGNIVTEGKIVTKSQIGGYLNILKGDLSIQVNYNKPFDTLPIVNVSCFDSEVKYVIKNVTKEGFLIELKETQDSDVEFAWFTIYTDNSSYIKSR